MFLITLAAQYLGYENQFSDFIALHYFQSKLFKPHQLITYAFMHGGFMHIAFNMLAFWMFGASIENYWGSKKFLIYYLFTAIGAALTYLAWQYVELSPLLAHINAFIQNPDPTDLQLLFDKPLEYLNTDFRTEFVSFMSAYQAQPTNTILIQQGINYAQQLAEFNKDIPMVGASGGVYGVLLAFGMIYPNMLIYVYFLFPIKAKYFVLGYGLLELWSAVQNHPGDNVAHLAHLGGMLFGIILILLWKKKGNF